MCLIQDLHILKKRKNIVICSVHLRFNTTKVEKFLSRFMVSIQKNQVSCLIKLTITDLFSFTLYFCFVKLILELKTKIATSKARVPG